MKCLTKESSVGKCILCEEAKSFTSLHEEENKETHQSIKEHTSELQEKYASGRTSQSPLEWIKKKKKKESQ